MEKIDMKLDKISATPSKMRKSIKASLIAAAMIVIFTITGFATDGFGFLKYWKEVSIKESKSMEELISGGYGEKVNVSCQDKDIKVTMENVVADDTGTIISYEIEDLSKSNKYSMNYEDGISFMGNFMFPFEGFTNPIKGHSILYSDSPWIQKGMFRLDPIKDMSSNIEIIINNLNFGDRKPLSRLEGNWEFKIPVKKYESKVYAVNKEVDIDGNKILIKEIRIAPTNTSLTLCYKENQNAEYSITAFNQIKLRNKGIEYGYKSMGNSTTKGDSSGLREISLEFDSMYLEDPEEVEIYFGSYVVNVHKYAHYKIDINKPFPQTFEYFGSRISIDGIKVEKGKTTLTILQNFDKNKYEEFELEFRAKGQIIPYLTYDEPYEVVIFDGSGNVIDEKNMDESWEKAEPRVYFTKETIVLHTLPHGITQLPGVNKNVELEPEAFTVAGYRETRYINESFKIKLK